VDTDGRDAAGLFSAMGQTIIHDLVTQIQDGLRIVFQDEPPVPQQTFPYMMPEQLPPEFWPPAMQLGEPMSHDLLLMGLGMRLPFGKGLTSKVSRPCAAEATALRNPNVYEALFESPISGTSRAAHRASANEFFANQLRNDAQLNGMFNQELGGNVLQQMESGSSGLRNPPGTVWHHPFDSPNVMQLLRTSEHTAPSLQPVLHPSGVGGFGNFYGP
jgi:hypothetical protein